MVITKYVRNPKTGATSSYQDYSVSSPTKTSSGTSGGGSGGISYDPYLRDAQGNPIGSAVPPPGSTPESIQASFKSAGGGGGGTSTTPSTTYDPARDVPVTKAPSYSGVVSAGTTSQTFSYAKNILKEDKSLQGGYQAGKTIYEGLKQKYKDYRLRKEIEKEKKLEEEAKGKQFYTEIIPTATGVSGTGEIRRTLVPIETLVRDATLGDEASQIAYTTRVQDSINAAARDVAQKELQSDQQKVDTQLQIIQSKINTGEITLAQGKEDLKTYASNLDENRLQRVEERLNPLVEAHQKRLEAIGKAGAIATLGITIAGSAALGYVSVPAVAALPKLVQTGIGVVTGVTLVHSASKLGADVAVGKAGALEIAQFTLPLASFGAGAYIKTKVIAKDYTKFENIMKNPKLEITLKDIKVLTTESQIKALKIPPEQEASLIAQFNLGKRVGTQKYDIQAPSLKEQAIINKFIPKREIISIGEVKTISDGTEGFIQGGYFTKVKLGKGFNKYVEFQLGKYEGTFSPKTGEAIVETTSIRTPKKIEVVEDLLEISKTKTYFPKPVVEYASHSETGQIIARGIKTKGFTFEGAKKVGTKEKPITYKDLQEVVTSEKYGRYPTTKTTQIELQELKNIKFAVRQFETGAGDIFGVVGKERTFTTKAAKIKTEPFVEPIEFGYSKAMKPFESHPPLPSPEPPKLNQQQSKVINKIDKPIEPQYPKMVGGKGIEVLDYSKVFPQPKQFKFEEFNIEQLPPIHLPPQIKRGIIHGVGQINKPINIPTIIDGGLLNIGIDTRQGIVNKNILKTLQKNQLKVDNGLKEIVINVPVIKGILKTRIKEIVIPTEVQVVSPRLDQQLKQRFIQPQELVIPRIRTPVIPRFKIPKLITPFIPFPSSGQGGGSKQYKRFQRKAKKAQSDYTASLAAAVVQAKPFKVTRKQYARLKKGTYTGIEARPVLQIVDEKDLKREIRKVDFGS